jgi:septal ring factor EnvC (AmiA/AmiB activator)
MKTREIEQTESSLSAWKDTLEKATANSAYSPETLARIQETVSELEAQLAEQTAELSAFLKNLSVGQAARLMGYTNALIN